MSKLTLPDILTRTSNWRKRSDGGYNVILGHHPWSAHITNEELAQIDTRLPIIVNHWFSQRNEHNGNTPLMSHRVIKLSLDLWQHPLTLRSIEELDFQVGTIEEVKLLTPCEVQFRLMCYDVVHAETIPYVQSATSDVIVMRPEKLDIQFPGWQTRLGVHQSLDSEKSLLKTYVFNEQVVALNTTTTLLPDSLT